MENGVPALSTNLLTFQFLNYQLENGLITCYNMWVFTTCLANDQLHLMEEPGPGLNIKIVLPGMGIPMLKIRQSRDHLTFNVGIPILVIWHLYTETASWAHFNICISRWKYSHYIVLSTGKTTSILIDGPLAWTDISIECVMNKYLMTKKTLWNSFHFITLIGSCCSRHLINCYLHPSVSIYIKPENKH